MTDDNHPPQPIADLLVKMGHKLPAPVNAIVGYTRMLLEGLAGPLNEMQAADLARIHHNSLQLLAMLSDIQTYARLEAGQLAAEAECGRFAMGDVLAQAAQAARERLGGKPLALAVLCEDDLPSVCGVANFTAQVLENLLGHLLEFMTEGEITLSAGHSPENLRGQPAVQVIVAGQGASLPLHHPATIFEPLHDLRSAEGEVVGNTGLRLAVARALVALQGGELWLAQLPPGMAVFCLLLSLADE
jgi:signal transduction histidine kinase